MDSIHFSSVVPQVFATRANQLHSDIWNTEAYFKKGHLYLVEADSGKGKSTFCSYILGYRNDYSGLVSFDDNDTRNYRVSDWVKMRQCHISHLFQELRLFPELTALENVMIKNNLTHFKSHEEIVHWFEKLGIIEQLHAKVGRMSFGQQQRVAMIRALVQPFDFILLDEPISHLDDTNGQVMGDMMMAEAQRQGAGVIVTSIGKHMALEYEHVFHL